MIRLLQFLIWGYVPRWKIIREVDLIIYGENNEERKKGRRYILQCEQTGRIKQRDCT